MEILFSLGPFKLYTLSLFWVLAFLWAGFVIAKKNIEYHLSDLVIYDGLIVSFVVGLLIFKVLGWMGVEEMRFWGLALGVLMGVGVVIKKEKVNFFTVMDLTLLGVMMGLSWWSVGLMVAATNILELRLSLVEAILYLLAFIVLWRLERIYRLIAWYRGKRSSARTGFIFGSGLLMLAFLRLLRAVIAGKTAVVIWVSELVVLWLVGIMVVYGRSGQSLFLNKRSGGNYWKRKKVDKKK